MARKAVSEVRLGPIRMRQLGTTTGMNESAFRLLLQSFLGVPFSRADQTSSQSCSDPDFRTAVRLDKRAEICPSVGSRKTGEV